MNEEKNSEIANPELFREFLSNQRQEFSLKEKELELEREKTLASKEIDERQFHFASRQLEATERDRESERNYRKSLR